MNNNQNETGYLGVVSHGIKTPIIEPGDDLKKIVIDSIIDQAGHFNDKDIIAVTEAVVAISQNNFVTPEDIQIDISNKFHGATELAIVDPIQSRNRFMQILKAIVKTPVLKKVYIFMTYPCDEVGNRFISEESIMEAGINPYKDVFSVEGFYNIFGEPKHEFTGKNYIKEYQNACEGKAEIIMCNDFSRVKEYCENILVCSIHRKEMTKRILKNSGAKNVLDLSEIMNTSINGSGFNTNYGLYGSNMMAEGKLKLMPRDCEKFVQEIQEEVKRKYNVNVEVMVYGDGAFKDPVGGIWELADPTTTLGATSGLIGTPKEVKLKYLASLHKDKSKEEIEAIIAKEKEARISSGDITGVASLGTTPRRLTDLLASLSDLTTGSGDRQTPVVLISGYLK